jgi:hypothetical protein
MTIQITLGPQVAVVTENGATVVPNGTIFSSNVSWVSSQNEEYILTLQTDGNLVLYRLIGNPPPLAPGLTISVEALWATGTSDSGDTFVVQKDGNLVVYNSAGSPIWASNTNGTNSEGLFVQNDGNLVLYKLVPAWASNT